ncbi:hypothetical protein EDC02_7643 [Micromonospora sp. Llam0]|uniref:hypothetical protein n=1 Tax=Micromonospora sp. Llam0 TaxID=2485143 RepID=UPI000FBB8D7E|nr:hypothetical protein [Micromonospora sp. Llam0]ROO52703.1 hypothetical protein EDC02_7643 [Micromonospora sp. Llam0]
MTSAPEQSISTPPRLTERLREVGVQARQDRNTALFALAGEVPAVLLARMLAIHVTIAVQSTRRCRRLDHLHTDIAHRQHITPPPTE